MDISHYADFFHDGSILDVRHINNNIELSMVSAEMDKDDTKDNIVLSNDDSIQGILHIEGVKNILINDIPYLGKITKKYDSGKIFDFELARNFVELSIHWINYAPKSEVNEFSVIRIEAEKIWWENIPNLEESS